MKRFANAFLTLSLLLPLTACPADDEPQPEGPIDFPEITACQLDVDDGKDGTLDGRWTYTYKDGHQLKESLDTGLDGTVDETWDYVFTGDDMTRFEWRIADEKGQLALTYAADMTYDAEGRLLTQTDDSDGDGVDDSKTTFVRDADGRLLEIRDDDGNDGTIDSVTKHVYDSEGVRTHSDIDGDNDGTVDGKKTYTYNPDGRLIRSETDRDLDGTADRIEVREYGSDGFRSRDARDLDADGVFDFEDHYTFVDGRWNTQELVFRTDGEDTRSLQTFGYDCAAEKAAPARAARIADVRADVREKLLDR